MNKQDDKKVALTAIFVLVICMLDILPSFLTTILYVFLIAGCTSYGVVRLYQEITGGAEE